jgi:multidrug resistance efflux pump
MKKMLVGIVAALVILVVVFAITSKKGQDKISDIKTGGSKPVPELKTVAAEGKVEALPGYEIEVGSEIEGRIAEFHVEEGSYIKKGGLIARMEDRDIRAKLKEAEAEASSAWAKYREVATGSRDEEIRRADAALERAVADAETARKEAERYHQLYEESLVSRSSFENMDRAGKVAEARRKEAAEEMNLVKQGPKQETIKYYHDSSERAKASLQYWKTILDKTIITAPISGKVIRKYLQKGEMVSKDVTPNIAAIADPDKVRVSAEVDETDVAGFNVGDPAEITSYAYPGKVFPGTVMEIADYVGQRKVLPNNPQKNRDMKILQVKIGLAEKTPFRLGMTVDVKIYPKGR